MNLQETHGTLILPKTSSHAGAEERSELEGLHEEEEVVSHTMENLAMAEEAGETEWNRVVLL